MLNSWEWLVYFIVPHVMSKFGRFIVPHVMRNLDDLHFHKYIWKRSQIYIIDIDIDIDYFTQTQSSRLIWDGANHFEVIYDFKTILFDT